VPAGNDPQWESPRLHAVELKFLDQSVELKLADESLAETLTAIYKPFLRPLAPGGVPPEDSIRISAISSTATRSVTHGSKVTECGSIAQLLYVIDKTVTTELQVRRPELYFVHAAAVSNGAHAILLVGEPGAGKSTLCWALCNAGYRYFSDELAPVRLGEMTVEPFPRAISLKSVIDELPAPPAKLIDAAATMHVPADLLPRGYQVGPLPIETIVFLQLRIQSVVATPRL
jgi:hypothetical protein